MTKMSLAGYPAPQYLQSGRVRKNGEAKARRDPRAGGPAASNRRATARLAEQDRGGCADRHDVRGPSRPASGAARGQGAAFFCFDALSAVALSWAARSEAS